ncbi:MAG: hypothetical protein R3F14_11545 [Polyangiaceae bacterium]
MAPLPFLRRSGLPFAFLFAGAFFLTAPLATPAPRSVGGGTTTRPAAAAPAAPISSAASPPPAAPETPPTIYIHTNTTLYEADSLLPAGFSPSPRSAPSTASAARARTPLTDLAAAPPARSGASARPTSSASKSPAAPSSAPRPSLSTTRRDIRFYGFTFAPKGVLDPDAEGSSPATPLA